MTRKSLLFSGAFVFSSILLAVSRPAFAEDGAVGGASSESFGAAFFISRNADGSLELLGSLIVWFLLCLSIVSIGLIIVLGLANRRELLIPEKWVKQSRRLVKNGEYQALLNELEGQEPFFCQTLYAGLREASGGFSAMIRSLEQTADELSTVRMRRVEVLNVLGQVSPMIGLFGTVYGMILAFQAIVVGGGSADPVLLAGGIGTALTTTFWGLVVAIPALAGYAFLRNRIDELTVEATLRAEEVVNTFRPRWTKSGVVPGDGDEGFPTIKHERVQSSDEVEPTS